MPPEAGNKVKVPVESLQIGWTVDQDIFLDTTLLLSSGAVITKSIVELLKRRRVDHIFVSPSSKLSEHAEEEPRSQLHAVFRSPNRILDLHGVETTVPLPIIKEACTQLDSTFDAARVGEFEIAQVDQAVDPVISPFLKTPADVVKLHDPEVDEYAVNHGIKVGLYYMVVARDWIDSEQEMRNLICGAILKDIGMAKINPEIVNKPGKLNSEEWAEMCQHPIWSGKILSDKGANESMLSMAMCHHERIDGSGYPYGLKGEEIDRHARLAAICDVYDAITSNKVYKGKTEYAFAIDEIIRCSGTHLDAEIANRFIRRIGRYPVGSFVELSNGETAVVVRISEQAIFRPVVSRIATKDKVPITERNDLDLNSRSDIHIVRALKPDDFL